MIRFTDTELDDHIRRRPSVQKIVLGAFLQQPMFLSSDVLGVPLSALGISDLATLVGSYISGDLDVHISVAEVEKFKEDFKSCYPGVVLVWHPARDASTEELRRSSEVSFRRAKKMLALVAGDHFEEIAEVMLHDEGAEWKLSPPRSKRRQRLWLSEKEANEFQNSLVRLTEMSEQDHRLSLALQLYLDAVNEKSDEFRLVKLYNVVECLSAPYKGMNGDGVVVGSRDAARILLGIEYGSHWSVYFKGDEILFDIIAVAGKFRDVIMHGSKVEKNTFAVADRGITAVLAFEPFKVADVLHQLVDDKLWEIARIN